MGKMYKVYTVIQKCFKDYRYSGEYEVSSKTVNYLNIAIILYTLSKMRTCWIQNQYEDEHMICFPDMSD